MTRPLDPPEDGGEGQADLPEADRTVDARGLLCPLPVLRARKALLSMAEGAVLRVLADDGMARIDLPHFCTEGGHAHLGLTESDGYQSHLIRRGPDRPEAD